MDEPAGGHGRCPRKKNATLAEQVRGLALRIAAVEAALSPGRQTERPKTPKRNPRAEERIVENVAATFSEQELADLSYEFGIDYEAVLGTGVKNKARGLVGHFARRGYLEVLVNQLAMERPHVDWHGALLDTNELK